MVREKQKPKRGPARAPVGELIALTIFTTGGQRFALKVESTEGVVNCPPVTPLPSAPDGIIGVCSVRGRMVIVFDPLFRRGVERGRVRLILLKGEAQLGVVADRVEGVIEVPVNRIRSGRKKSGARAANSPSRSYYRENGELVPILDPRGIQEG